MRIENIDHTTVNAGADPGGGPGARAPPLTTKNEAPAPKFYKTEAPEWQFSAGHDLGPPPDQILDPPLQCGLAMNCVVKK